jgi:hypothetical protein
MNSPIKPGDKIKIIKDRIGNKMLANVELGEELVITSVSECGKIMYHHNSLALPVNSDCYKKISITPIN